MIAMALAAGPGVLIADEPTTALDVTVQQQILDLLREIAARTAAVAVFITHDLGVVAQVADRVAVMYAGRIVEEGPAQEVLRNPRHPYTEGLLRAAPRLAAGTHQADSRHGAGARRVAAGMLVRAAMFVAARFRCDAAMPELFGGLTMSGNEARCILAQSDQNWREAILQWRAKTNAKAELVRDRFTRTAEVFGDFAVKERVREAELLGEAH